MSTRINKHMHIVSNDMDFYQGSICRFKEIRSGGWVRDRFPKIQSGLFIEKTKIARIIFYLIPQISGVAAAPPHSGLKYGLIRTLAQYFFLSKMSVDLSLEDNLTSLFFI